MPFSMMKLNAKEVPFMEQISQKNSQKHTHAACEHL